MLPEEIRDDVKIPLIIGALICWLLYLNGEWDLKVTMMGVRSLKYARWSENDH